MTQWTVRLGDVASFNPAPPKGLVGSEKIEVAFVPMASVSESGTMRVAEHRIGSELNTGFSYFQNGDVLVAKITPCYENNKTCAVNIDREHGFGSTEFHVIRANPSELENRYLVHYLRQDTVREAGTRRMTGSAGQRRVPRMYLETLEIPLPQLDEQRRIAAILDQADEVRRKRQKTIRLGERLTTELFWTMFGDLVANTKGWSRGRVVDLVSHFESGKSLVADDDDSESSLNRVLKVSAVTSFRFDPSASKALPSDYKVPASHLVRFGDLLFSRANTTELIGATALVDVQCKNLALPDKIWRFCWRSGSGHTPLFVWQLFTQPSFRTQIQRRASGTSGSMKNISQEKVLGIEIGIPPVERRAQFEVQLSSILDLERTSSRQLASLDSLFASLQHRAFNGEL